MKTGKKFLRCIIALLFIAGIVSAIRFTSHQKNNNSDLDMETTNQEIQENQDIQDVQEAPAYPVIQPENGFEIMGPENGFDEQLEAGQLVLRGEYEDHADVIFIDQEMWQNYIDPHKMIYGDQVSFKGEVEQIDGAAGTHYYNATSIDTLEELFVVNVNDTVLKLQDRTFVENNDESLATTDQIEKNVDIAINLNGITTEERELYDENDNRSKKLEGIVNEIEKDYPELFNDRREYLIHFYDDEQTVGVIRFLHTINCGFEIGKNRIIQTNKSIICMYENGKITNIIYGNINGQVDEQDLIQRVQKFENNYTQGKKELSENEEFVDETIQYTYYYNVDKLQYTYNLFFYEGPQDMRVINNSRGTEYFIDKNGNILK